MRIEHIHFYVEDARQWRNWFVERLGFRAIATGTCNRHTHVEAIASGSIRFVLSSPLNGASPVAAYLAQHPPGVAEIGFGVADLERRGGQISLAIEEYSSPTGRLRWGRLSSPTQVEHTLIERTGETPLLPDFPDWIAIDPRNDEGWFNTIDHVVFNVGVGELEGAIAWYERVLGFERQQSFTIGTATSALYSQVMLHPETGVQFPINEPASANSQIQEFLDLNGGSGVQHIALATVDIAAVTRQLRDRGLSFLAVPSSYYQQLQQGGDLPLSVQQWQDIQEAAVLVDWESNPVRADSPLLLQIFTQPIFACPTFFLELIERRGRARGFGEGNFRALFEAMEREQLQRQSP